MQGHDKERDSYKEEKYILRHEALGFSHLRQYGRLRHR